MKFKTNKFELSNIKYLVTQQSNQKPNKAIILFTEAYGINGHMKDVACRFANLGYRVYIPQIYDKKEIDFHVPYHKHELRNHLLSSMSISLLSSRLENSKNYFEQYETLHSIGFSIGGYLSLLSTSILPINKNISFYPNPSPSNMNYPNFPNMDSWLSKSKNSLILLGDQDHSLPNTEILFFNKNPELKVHTLAGQHGFFCNNRHTYNKHSATKSMEIITFYLME